MDGALIDTDMLSEVLKRQDQRVLAKASHYLATHSRLTFSAITFYEIIRGLHLKQSKRQLAAFLRTARSSNVLLVDIPVLSRAGELWAQAHTGGFPRADADLIIAATALEHDRVLVTGNTPHFAWIPGIRLEDWRQP
jgi:tRNA(fMet)-specific endonuclease VapC